MRDYMVIPPVKHCECGCGMVAPVSRNTDAARGYVAGARAMFAPGHTRRRPAVGRYKVRHVPDHPQADSKGCVYEHVLIASAALGKALPLGSHVHHVDNDRHNNAPTNLVICQDIAYHKLLHARAATMRRGVNPNTHRICGRCDKALPFSAFSDCTSNKGFGLQRRCRQCARAVWSLYSINRNHNRATVTLQTAV